jgi:hypothetical protein
MLSLHIVIALYRYHFSNMCTRYHYRKIGSIIVSLSYHIKKIGTVIAFVSYSSGNIGNVITS